MIDCFLIRITHAHVIMRHNFVVWVQRGDATTLGLNQKEDFASKHSKQSIENKSLKSATIFDTCEAS